MLGSDPIIRLYASVNDLCNMSNDLNLLSTTAEKGVEYSTSQRFGLMGECVQTCICKTCSDGCIHNEDAGEH